MSKRKEIDDYINAAAPFAQPILNHLRDLIHQVCPETEEKLKWGFPHFDYKGVYVSMASFKEHCAFNFWKASLMKDPEGLWAAVEEKAMGHFGKIRSLDDLPSDEVLLAYLVEAKQLNDLGAKRPVKRPSEVEKKELETPADLLEQLNGIPAALEHFEKFSWSQRKDYNGSTRQKRNLPA
jgi:hypothetical protein